MQVQQRARVQNFASKLPYVALHLRQLHVALARPRVGAHMNVSAVNAEIVGGTLPVKRFSRRSLRHNVPGRTPRVGRETARRRRGVQFDQPGKRRDAR